MSEEEFLRLPESMDRIELLDGEVVVGPAATYRHQEIVRRIVVALSAWAERQKHPVTVGLAPVDIRFGPARILQPDLFVLWSKVSWSQKGPIDRVPELCIEVLSRDRVYDRVTKRLVYAAAGVAEYWVVDLDRTLVERWSGPGLDDANELRTRLKSPLLPGLSLDLRRLFAE
jgi:Uma2 family endonuclease